MIRKAGIFDDVDKKDYEVIKKNYTIINNALKT